MITVSFWTHGPPSLYPFQKFLQVVRFLYRSHNDFSVAIRGAVVVQIQPKFEQIVQIFDPKSDRSVKAFENRVLKKHLQDSGQVDIDFGMFQVDHRSFQMQIVTGSIDMLFIIFRS